jgi:hypothetical protein
MTKLGKYRFSYGPLDTSKRCLQSGTIATLPEAQIGDGLYHLLLNLWCISMDKMKAAQDEAQ